MAYYTPSRTGSGSSRMQMVPYNSAPRSSASRKSSTSSQPDSYYGDPPKSSSRSQGSSRGPYYATTEVSITSVQTMGSPERQGYVSGQAPAGYFHNDTIKMKWDAVVLSRQGRMPPPRTRGTEDPYQMTQSAAGRIWREDDYSSDELSDECSIVPGDSISNVGSVRSGGGRSGYYSARRGPGMSERDRIYAPSGAVRSGLGDARTEVVNGRKVRQMYPL